MEEFTTNALADVYNLGRHFFKPFSKHSPQCNCVLCSDHDDASHNTKTKPLIPEPTSSDLDLLKTDSKSIRQLVVFDKECTSKSLRNFIHQLQTFIHYAVAFNKTVDLRNESSFHVLVVVTKTDLSDEQCKWLEYVLEQRIAKRIVFIGPHTDTLSTQQTLRFTSVSFRDYDRLLDVLVHGMLVTKQRLMPKDLLRFLEPGVGSMHAAQQGFCLFY